ncbi:MAG: hypothetical protein AB8B65_06385 [Kordia sp.]|uniref:hypothetical protein n=1 Tax=Kordia sp. TaxID=1965332 RepID=UPI00385BB2DF
MKKTHFRLLLIVFAISITSCASFSSRITQDQIIHLTEENIQNIEGTYEIESYDSYFKAGKEIVEYKKTIQDTTIHNFTSTQDIDSTLLKKLVVDIKLLSNTKIKFTYRHQNTTIEETVLGMKLRKNGMIHLKNKKSHITGIPLLFGNLEIDKSRIGISKNNDLVIHNINHSTGGALIIFSSFDNHNTTYYFKRI